VENFTKVVFGHLDTELLYVIIDFRSNVIYFCKSEC
jgi:hypothetical protein